MFASISAPHELRNEAYDAESRRAQLQRRLHDVPRVAQLAVARLVQRGATAVGQRGAIELHVPRQRERVGNSGKNAAVCCFDLMLKQIPSVFPAVF